MMNTQTSGASPALAKRLKREIAEEFGEPYARLAELLNDLRAWAKDTFATYQERKVFFESIVNGDPSDDRSFGRRNRVQQQRVLELMGTHAELV